MHELPDDSFSEVQPDVEDKHSLNASRYNPRVYLAEIFRHGVTIGANIGTSFLFEAVAITGGGIAAGVNPFTQIDSKLALMAWMVSYFPFMHSLSVNAKEAWKSLEETGTSISWFAKIGYDVSKYITSNTSIQKAATYTGFSATEIAKEVPWFVGTFLGKEKLLEIGPEHYTPNMEFAFMTGANLTATLYGYVQVGGVEGVLQTVKHKERLLVIVNSGLNRLSKRINNVIF